MTDNTAHTPGIWDYDGDDTVASQDWGFGSNGYEIFSRDENGEFAEPIGSVLEEDDAKLIIQAPELKAENERLIHDIERHLKGLASAEAEVDRLTALNAELVEALTAATQELEIRVGPYVVFDVHTHYQTGEILWEADDCGFWQAGGFPFPMDEGPDKETFLEFYRDDLTALAADALEGVGYGVGVIPISIGLNEEDPPWEPVFSRAYMVHLAENSSGCPALENARAALAKAEAQS